MTKLQNDAVQRQNSTEQRQNDAEQPFPALCNGKLTLSNDKTTPRNPSPYFFLSKRGD
ncbi:MAG: hypothetical protein HQ525_05305 [Anaerolineae bacterium]|nr:hypothetical protein [Anaerolineae bacterium]